MLLLLSDYFQSAMLSYLDCALNLFLGVSCIEFKWGLLLQRHTQDCAVTFLASFSFKELRVVKNILTHTTTLCSRLG